MSYLELKKVEKSFSGQKIIHPTDLKVEKGEFVVLVGPSGSGKSTLLRMIAGIETVDSGGILCEGLKISHLHPKDRDMAMVFQNYALYPHMTVAENMGLSLKFAKVDSDKIASTVSETAKMLDIQHLLKRRPTELSGGQRQRVAMGRALVRNPKVFLFDEPLSNLDAKLRSHMRVEIKRLHKKFGITTIYVTHDQTEAMTLADKIVVLKDGKIEQVGSPRDLFVKPHNSFVASFIGTPEMNLFALDMSKKGGLEEAFREILRGNTGLQALEDQGAGAPRAAGQVLVGVRPDYKSTKGEKSNSLRLRSTVDIVEVLGTDVMLEMTLEDAPDVRLCRVVPYDDEVRPGVQMELEIPMSEFHFFCKKSKRRLELSVD